VKTEGESGWRLPFIFTAETYMLENIYVYVQIEKNGRKRFFSGGREHPTMHRSGQTLFLSMPSENK